jgi:hypothetical protein
MTIKSKPVLTSSFKIKFLTMFEYAAQQLPQNGHSPSSICIEGSPINGMI